MQVNRFLVMIIQALNLDELSPQLICIDSFVTKHSNCFQVKVFVEIQYISRGTI